MVSGLHWCKNEPRAVGNARLTGKILCRKHNSDLSGLDYSVKQSFDTLDEAWRLYGARSGRTNRSWTQRTFKVDGVLLERWFLKTLINLSHGDQWAIGEGTHEAGMPNDELVRIAFGRSVFREKAGLYLASYDGQQEVRVYPGLSCIPKTIGNNLMAGLFTFAGLNFFLSLMLSHLQEDKGARLIYHLPRLQFGTHDDKGRPVKSHRVDIVWQ